MTTPLLLQGTASALPLKDASVQCVVCSPPYFGLRDYATATWHGGDPACPHSPADTPQRRGLASSTLGGGKDTSGHQQEGYTGRCARCGATRVDAQIGLEGTLDAYLAALVAVFREVWRVLHPTGTLWLNISDSYNSARGGRSGNLPARTPIYQPGETVFRGAADGLKEKDLCMVPARLALALQADGWTLRSEIVWHKLNPMPESVTDRVTRSHEMVYMFSKQARYYYDADAVKEASTETSGWAKQRAQGVDTWGYTRPVNAHAPGNHNGQGGTYGSLGTRSLRSVWSLPTEPTPFAHFATFPTELVRRCILAGTSAHGCCAACGAPWRRGMERTDQVAENHNGSYFDRGKSVHHGHVQEGPRYVSVPTDWHPTCACNAAVQPCTILDPFCGSGTTLLVARELGRQGLGLDLSCTYLRDIARARLGLTALHAWEHGAPPTAVSYADLPLFQEATL